MKIYEHRNFPWIKHTLSFLADNTLSYEYRSFNKKIINLLPLAYLYPQEEMVKRYSKKAVWLTLILTAVSFIFPLTYIFDLGWENIWDFNSAWCVVVVLSALTGTYCTWNAKRENLVFCYKNGALALSLPYEEKIQNFKNEIIKQSIQASHLEDRKNLEFLKNKISQLSKEKIINSEFEAELHARLMSISLPT
jgi:hypothetical protein